MTDQMVDVILQLRAAHLEFLNFLVCREIHFFFDPINLVIEPMIFIVQMAEMIVRAFEAANGFAMFRKLSQDWMMEVHGRVWSLG